jgi:hypothetical protein
VAAVVLSISVSNADRKRQVLMDAIDKISVSRGTSTAGVVEAFELANDRLFTTEAGSHPNEIRVSLICRTYHQYNCSSVVLKK